MTQNNYKQLLRGFLIDADGYVTTSDFHVTRSRFDYTREDHNLWLLQVFLA